MLVWDWKIRSKQDGKELLNSIIVLGSEGSEGINLDYDYWAHQYDEDVKKVNEIDKICDALAITFDILLKSHPLVVGQCRLYQHCSYGGRSVVINGLSRNLGKLSFNNVASSIKIMEGIWFLYQNENFQGGCYIKKKGNFSNLPHNDTLSSIRGIPDTSMYNGAVVAVFVDSGYKGAGLALAQDEPDLVKRGWNDMISSIVVSGNKSWIFYADCYYKGKSWIVKPGFYDNVSKLGIGDNCISSMKIKK